MRRALMVSGPHPDGQAPAKAEDDGFAVAGKKGKKKGGRADPSLLGFSVESSRIMQGEIDRPE